MRARLRRWPLGIRLRLGSGEALELSQKAAERLRGELRTFAAGTGAVGARERAERIAAAYLELDDAGRLELVRMIATELDTPADRAEAAAQHLLAASGRDLAAALDEARLGLEAPWRALLSELNALDGGTKFLLDLRADLLGLAEEHPELRPFEHDLKRLLAGYFEIGFLGLHRITWDSPASLLETFANEEAVHQVAGWDDLKNRLDPDRRFFAFFHPRLPAEPLIFVQVALVDGLPAEIGPLLDPEAPQGDPRSADTAVFYSISAAQPGLAGISFGGFLIKQVVDALALEFPRLRTFATLSPIPGFRRWLEVAVRAPAMPFGEAERAALTDALAARDLDDTEPHRELLLRACSHYLLNAKRSDLRAADPVAHFHLSNGARVERINWRADTSSRGVAASLGMMVNYLYHSGDLHENQQAYASGRVVASGSVSQAAQLEKR